MRKQSKREPMIKMRSNLRETMRLTGKDYFVYSLECPVDKKIRWVGYTQSLDGRFEIHWYQMDANNILKWGWILALHKWNRFPLLKLMKAFNTKKDAMEYEKFMIFKHRDTVLNKNIPKQI